MPNACIRGLGRPRRGHHPQKNIYVYMYIYIYVYAYTLGRNACKMRCRERGSEGSRDGGGYAEVSWDYSVERGGEMQRQAGTNRVRLRRRGRAGAEREREKERETERQRERKRFFVCAGGGAQVPGAGLGTLDEDGYWVTRVCAANN